MYFVCLCVLCIVIAIMFMANTDEYTLCLKKVPTFELCVNQPIFKKRRNELEVI